MGLSLVNYFDLDNTKAECIVRECTNPKKRHNDGGFHSFCNRCRDRRHESKFPAKYAFNNLRKSARKRDIPFTLTLEQFEKFCAETGYLTLRGGGSDDMTVDRIESKKGYEDGNLRMATNFQNGSKRDRPDLPAADIAPAEDRPW